MISLYPASRTRHSRLWIELANRTTSQIHWVARWPYLIGVMPPSPEAARNFWLDDLADIARAEVLLVYSDPGDDGKLAGALVEAGAALALGKRVIVVGDSPQYSSWQYHPSVARVDTLAEGLALAANSRLGSPWYDSLISDIKRSL